MVRIFFYSFLFLIAHSIIGNGVKISGKIIFKKTDKIIIKKFEYDIQKTLIVKEINVDSNGNFSVNFNINKPILAQIFNSFIYISPNDNINITICSFDSINVIGKNRGNYTFFNEIKKYTNPAINYSMWKNDLNAYKILLKKYYSQLETTLIKFEKNKIISKEFFIFSQEELKLRYLNNLILPIASYTIKPDEIPNQYLNEVSSFFLKKNFLYSNNYYMLLSEYFALKSNHKKVDSLSFKSIKKNLEINFKGRDLEFLCLQTIRLLARNQNINGKSKFDSLYNYSIFSIKDKIYNEEIKYWKVFYEKVNKIIPSNIGEIELLDSELAPITFDKILKNNSGKVIYIDFWASWCGPCIQELPFSEKLKNKFENKNLSIIYISIDSKIDNWQQGSIKNGGLKNNSFLLLSGFFSDISKYFNINSIPKYLVIGKDGKLKMLDAIRPSDSNIYSTLNNYLKE